MAWKVEQLHDRHVICTLYSGDISARDVQEATVAALMRAQGDGPHRFLAEFEDARLQMSLAEIFSVPDQWQEAEVHPRNKLALVVPEGSVIYEETRFFVVSSRSRGHQVRLFPERPAALRWLAEDN